MVTDTIHNLFVAKINHFGIGTVLRTVTLITNF